MSLVGLQLKNFKCFASSGHIRLAPLTLIFGRNNSGKSTLIQSLLLLRQSIGAAVYGARLNLEGPLYAAGSYSDIIHLHRTTRLLGFAFSLSYQEASSAAIELEFTGDDPKPPRLARLTIDHGDPHTILDIRRGTADEDNYELWIGNQPQGDGAKARFLFPESGLFPLIGDERERRGRAALGRTRARELARLALEHLQKCLRDLRVIGAFRRPPERRYEYRPTGVTGPDATGREVVDALLESAMGKPAKAASGLLEAVNDWLRKMASVQIRHPQSIGGSIFALEIIHCDSGRWANYADVGFGIGQALPVLVEGLRTPEGGIFIVQEPEIHLHPDAQLAMADFLIALSQTGRQVIVETHSEPLLLRVRSRVLDRGKRGIRKEDVSLIRIAGDDRKAARATSLELDDLGQIGNWPTGFFQEANNERMALLKKMAAKREIDE